MPAENDPLGVARLLEWGWTVVLGLLGLVWRQHQRAVTQLEARVSELEKNHRTSASKADISEIKALILEGHREAKAERDRIQSFTSAKLAELHRKLDENITRTNDEFLRLLRDGRGS